MEEWDQSYMMMNVLSLLGTNLKCFFLKPLFFASSSLSHCVPDVLGDESLMKRSFLRSLYIRTLSDLFHRWHVAQLPSAYVLSTNIDRRSRWIHGIGFWPRVKHEVYLHYATTETFGNQHVEFLWSHLPQKFVFLLHNRHVLHKDTSIDLGVLGFDN